MKIAAVIATIAFTLPASSSLLSGEKDWTVKGYFDLRGSAKTAFDLFLPHAQTVQDFFFYGVGKV